MYRAARIWAPCSMRERLMRSFRPTRLNARWSTRRACGVSSRTTRKWSATTTSAPESSRSCTVVIRRELLQEHPGIAEVVYQGFCDAKKAAQDKYRIGLIFNNMDT